MTQNAKLLHSDNVIALYNELSEFGLNHYKVKRRHLRTPLQSSSSMPSLISSRTNKAYPLRIIDFEQSIRTPLVPHILHSVVRGDLHNLGVEMNEGEESTGCEDRLYEK